MNQFEQFFEYYGRVLSEGDLTGIANCYAVPGLVLGDENNIAIADLKEVEKSFAGAAEYYRSQGGESVQQTYYHYLLRSTPDGKLKIQVVIAHPEA